MNEKKKVIVIGGIKHSSLIASLASMNCTVIDDERDMPPSLDGVLEALKNKEDQKISLKELLRADHGKRGKKGKAKKDWHI